MAKELRKRVQGSTYQTFSGLITVEIDTSNPTYALYPGVSEARCGLVWEKSRKGRQPPPHSPEREHRSSLPGLQSKDGDTHTHTQMQWYLNTKAGRHVWNLLYALPRSITATHTYICQVIRTHLGACHLSEWGEGVPSPLTCLVCALTFSCFVLFSNILISIGSFARREAKYTSCIFRAASAEGGRVSQVALYELTALCARITWESVCWSQIWLFFTFKATFIIWKCCSGAKTKCTSSLTAASECISVLCSFDLLGVNIRVCVGKGRGVNEDNSLWW